MDAAIELYLPQKAVEIQLQRMGCQEHVVESMMRDPHVAYRLSDAFQLRATPLPHGFHQAILQKTSMVDKGPWQCLVIGGKGFDKIARDCHEVHPPMPDYGLRSHLISLLSDVDDWIFYFSPKYDYVNRVERVSAPRIVDLLLESICVNRTGFIATP